jgi:hypothetical protein
MGRTLPRLQTYSYCNLIFWTILIEIDSVIVPAYFPIVIALITLKVRRSANVPVNTACQRRRWSTSGP